MGHGEGGDYRLKQGVKTKGPTRLITDLCIFEPNAITKELEVTSLHHGVNREQIQENCNWAVKFADKVSETPVPTTLELQTLRDINARTKAAHGG
jgi:glutaconate CoA-transferase, subunit B